MGQNRPAANRIRLSRAGGRKYARHSTIAAVVLIAMGIASCQQPRYRLVEQPAEPRPVPAAERTRPPTFDPWEAPAASDTASAYRLLDWVTLRGLNPRTGAVSAVLRRLEGGAVRIKGYMVPFADEYETAQEFLLVPQFGMCIHTPPPPANPVSYTHLTLPTTERV